jgi:hypothetical protein
VFSHEESISSGKHTYGAKQIYGRFVSPQCRAVEDIPQYYLENQYPDEGEEEEAEILPQPPTYRVYDSDDNYLSLLI